MELKTRRLRIRFIQEADWPSLIEIWSDFDGSPYAQYDGPHDLDPESAREKSAQWEMTSPGREHMFFAVCLGERMIGLADFHRTPEGYECGYCFHSDYHGQGYAKESLSALLKWIAGGKQIRFTAGTALKNIPSVRLLQSLGFEKVGEEQVSFYKDSDGNDICFTGGLFALDVPARNRKEIVNEGKN